MRLRALIANVPLFPGVSYRADALLGTTPRRQLSKRASAAPLLLSGPACASGGPGACGARAAAPHARRRGLDAAAEARNKGR